MSERPPGQRGGPTFVVAGRITHGDEPLSGVTVRAVAVDRTGEQRLGEATTDGDGRYRITYSRPDFARVERGRAGLVVRIHNEVDTAVGASRRRHDVGREVQVDVPIPADARIEPTEYARLRYELDSHLTGTAVSGLAESDLSFLVDELGLGDRDVYPAGEESLTLLREAAKLSGLTPFGEQALYGLARQWGGIGDRTELANASAADVAEAIRAAVDEGIVHVDTRGLETAVGRSLATIRQSIERADTREATATITVFDDRRRPLANHAVRIADAGESGRSRTVRTDQSGRAGFAYLVETGRDDASRKFTVSVRNDAGASIHEETIDVTDGAVRDVTVGERNPGSSGSATVDALQSSGTLPVSEDLASSLSGVTLAGIRSAGGVDASANADDATLLESVANLELTTDLETASTLADLGFETQVDVAATTQAEFTRRTADALPADVAEVVHSRSVAQTFLLDNRMVDRRTALASGQVSKATDELPGNDSTENGGGD